MRTLHSGGMYTFPIDSDIYAVVPYRKWGAPWRWSLDVYMWNREPTAISEGQTIATNISKAEVIGLIKILGYPHEFKS